MGIGGWRETSIEEEGKRNTKGYNNCLCRKGKHLGESKNSIQEYHKSLNLVKFSLALARVFSMCIMYFSDLFPDSRNHGGLPMFKNQSTAHHNYESEQILLMYFMHLGNIENRVTSGVAAQDLPSPNKMWLSRKLVIQNGLVLQQNHRTWRCVPPGSPDLQHWSGIDGIILYSTAGQEYQRVRIL